MFGSRILALTEDGTHLLVWDMASQGKLESIITLIAQAAYTAPIELVNSIEFEADFTATHVLHPATYLNKVIVGSSQGDLQLWNISTG